jgi:hypothetical protein
LVILQLVIIDSVLQKFSQVAPQHWVSRLGIEPDRLVVVGDGVIVILVDEMERATGARARHRAVDSEGEVLEILVQPQRDKAAAVRLLRKLLRRQGFVPTVIVTDKLRSYGAALREIGSKAHS